MASFIVRSRNLRDLLEQWNQLVDQHQQPTRKGRFHYRAVVFDHLAQSEFRRIQWFYYNDNDEGVTIRLYDHPFFQAHQEDYVEKGDDVILRGHDLGKEQEPLKTQMRQKFDQALPATSFPGQLGGGPNKRQTRTAFFQDLARNQGGTAPPPNQNKDEEVNVEDRVSLLDTTVRLLHQFRQVILYGPPGTGKTRLARLAALGILNGATLEDLKWWPYTLSFQKLVNLDDLSDFEAYTHDELIGLKLDQAKKESRFDLVVFHPAYEYEQFIGGIAPVVGAQGLQYQPTPGIFHCLCTAARTQPSVVLLIDEINRGNLARLLGELVFALEYRGNSVRLPFAINGEDRLTIPPNLYIIATMNSSDRSIGHIDAAVKRRFGQMSVPPDGAVIRDFWNAQGQQARGEHLATLMDQLNQELRDASRGDELLTGHSYFLADPSITTVDLLTQVRNKWRYQVQQLLHDYGQVFNLTDDFFQRYSPEHLDQLP